MTNGLNKIRAFGSSSGKRTGKRITGADRIHRFDFYSRNFNVIVRAEPERWFWPASNDQVLNISSSYCSAPTGKAVRERLDGLFEYGESLAGINDQGVD